jgi:hypothetical protein
MTKSATVRKSLLHVLAERITCQYYALRDVLTVPPNGVGGNPRHGGPKWAVGAIILYRFVPFLILSLSVNCRSLPSHSPNDVHSLQFTEKILSQSTLTCGGGDEFLFLPLLKPSVGGSALSNDGRCTAKLQNKPHH